MACVYGNGRSRSGNDKKNEKSRPELIEIDGSYQLDPAFSYLVVLKEGLLQQPLKKIVDDGGNVTRTT